MTIPPRPSRSYNLGHRVWTVDDRVQLHFDADRFRHFNGRGWYVTVTVPQMSEIIIATVSRSQARELLEHLGVVQRKTGPVEGGSDNG